MISQQQQRVLLLVVVMAIVLSSCRAWNYYNGCLFVASRHRSSSCRQLQPQRTPTPSLSSSSSSSSSSLYMGKKNKNDESTTRMAAKTVTTLDPVPDHVHRVVLMRHGESEFNNANVFTGWSDIGLTKRGKVEAEEAGQVFASHGLTFRKCYSSVLTRAIVTAHRSLEAAGISYTPLHYDWRLNERHYGALQGLSKEQTAERLGRTRVMQWRRSYEARPPLMTSEHPHYDSIVADARYKHIPEIPLGESLQECQVRVIEAWKDIVRDMQQSESFESPYSLFVAHANTLRALVMHLDGIPSDEIEGLNIPTGIPFYYDVNKETGDIVSVEPQQQPQTDVEQVNGSLLGRFRGVYIADERKKRSYLERRRAANDPYLWALRDEQVARHMLVDDGSQDNDTNSDETLEAGMDGMEDEAAKNTQLFSPTMIRAQKQQGGGDRDDDEARLSEIRARI